MSGDLYRPPTITADVEQVDDALTTVRLYSGGRSVGYCELHPSTWRAMQHALAVGLSMSGARLTVQSREARTYHDPLTLAP